MRSSPTTARLWAIEPALVISRLPPAGTVIASGVIENSASETATGAWVATVPLPLPSSLTTTMIPTAARRKAITAVNEANTVNMLRSLSGAIGLLWGGTRRDRVTGRWEDRGGRAGRRKGSLVPITEVWVP